MSYQIRNIKTDKIIASSPNEKKILKNFAKNNFKKLEYYLCEVKIVNKKFEVLKETIKIL